MTAKKPKLLFFAFFFPPYRAIASVRSACIAKQLSRIGWDVTVVTPHPSLLQDYDDPEKVRVELERWGVKRLFTGYRWRCLGTYNLRSYHPGRLRLIWERICRRLARAMGIDELIGWNMEARRACAKLTSRDVDVILATGGAFGIFRVAKKLSETLGRPYVLDYRDLWTGNPHAPARMRERSRNIERELLEGCSAVSVVSPSMAQYLSGRVGMADKVHVVSNGYDPDDFENVVPESFGHFAIVYTGGFYQQKRTAEPLMRALKRLMQFEPPRPWRFHYYGTCGAHVRELARKHGVEDRVELHDQVSRSRCLSAIGGAGVAIVVTSVHEAGDLADRGIITGKIFEPIGLGTPVMVVAPPHSDVEAVVHDAGRGAVFAGSDIEGMAAYLNGLLAGNVPPRNHPEKYAWTSLAQSMDAMLRKAMSGSAA